MREDYIQQIEQDLQYLYEFEETAKYLANRREDINNLREEIKFLIRELDEFTLSGTDYKRADILLMLKEILKKNAELAIEETKEFDLPEFKSALWSALDNEETYEIVGFGAGQVVIRVDLDFTAGTLSDYGLAIRKTRSEMGISKRRKTPLDPIMASEMWKNKYYKPAREGAEIPQPKKKERTSKRNPRKDKKEKREYNTEKYIEKYFETIKNRIKNFKKSAPFWRILNYGTTPLSSDWDGEAYPIVSPTFFVEKSVKEVQNLLLKETYGTDEKPLREILEEELEKLYQAARFIDEKSERLSNMLDDIEEPTTKREFTIVEVRRALGHRFGNADLNRILEVINDLETGMIDTEDRIELTKSGSKKRVRLRVKRLYQEVMDYKENM